MSLLGFTSSSVRAIALAGFGAAMLMAAPAYADGPFAGFEGNWSGTGTVSLSDGSKERIRCRASYQVGGGGNSLRQTLRCASDSYKFELQSDITYDGGNISGSWNEVTRQVHGSISGRATSNQIQAQASAIGFNASLSISTRGNSQSVSIKSPGSEISEVAISMARAGR